VIDIHCHILPQVDDGSKSWEMSLEMCRIAAADGIEHIVATPHANDRYVYDRNFLASRLDELRARTGIAPHFSLGCDFHLSYENLQDALQRPEKYVIEGTNYLLVELSNFSIPVQMNDCFSQLGRKGLTPILTHPERNPILQRSPEQILQWIELGCVIQVTAAVVTGSWGERAWSTAEWLFKRNAVHVVATDAHDTIHRVPVLSAARDTIGDFYGEEVARALVEDNPRAIVSNQPLPYFPDPVVKS
jgi:protein-tyrosine phosphatase